MGNLMQAFNFVMSGKKEELKEREKPMLPKKKKQVQRTRTYSECSTHSEDADSLFTEIQENNFEFEEDSDSTPSLKFQKTEAFQHYIQQLTKVTEMTCPCKRGDHNISDGKTAITQDFIDNKMGDLQAVQDQLRFLECTCESGNRVCESSIDAVQAVLDKIEALRTDYQDKFKAEIPSFKRQR